MKTTTPVWAARPLISILVLASIFFSATCFAQGGIPAGRIAKKVEEISQKGLFTKEINIFNVSTAVTPDPQISRIVNKYTLLDVHDLQSVSGVRPAYMKLTIPVDGARHLKVLLYQENISPNGFTLLTSSGVMESPGAQIVHYRGAIEGDPASVAAFTFTGNEVSGFINNGDGNYVIGKTDGASGRHIIYNDKDLAAKIPFDCATNTFLPVSPVTLARQEGLAVATKCVNWYWETDYDMFVNKGSVANVNTYMQGIFNEMATLYANDGMTMTLKTLFVWTTEDPYTGPTTSDYLNQFGAYRTSFDGDLAHLIGLKGSGGIAWINGVCKTAKYRMAYSGISTTYKTVPTYSWSVECITHEQGHLLGSPHTHDCSWNGNNTKIDGCGDAAGYPSGTCAVPATLPAGGGTIMSYCHLTSVGINLNLGFGPQPTTLMINTINGASCLVPCTTCAVPGQPGSISGNIAVCAATTQKYSIAAVSGATTYSWTLPSGWTGTSTADSIMVTPGSAGGTISVTANNSCGNSTSQTLSVTAAAQPLQPGVISGNSTVCAGTSQTYSVAVVNGATSYTWSLPAGWTGASTSNSIVVTTGAAGGTLSVNANNSCGSSIARTATITITSASPSQPSAISGNIAACAGSTQTYSVLPAADASSYAWILPSGWTGSSTASSITAITGTAGGNLSVTAADGCGTSASRTLAISISPLPAAPGAITVSGGTATVCTGDVRTYTTPLVAGVTYNWVVPSGTTITGGQGTNSIQLSFGTTFVSGSSLTVKAANSCGNSSAAGITISKSSISRPGTISLSGGSSRVCPGDIRTYSVTPVAGITYNWTAPVGATISSGQGTSIVKLTYTASFAAQGTLSVTANNNCGTSSARTLTISRNTLSTPGFISGPGTVCPNATNTYSISPVSGALSYLWTVPPGASIVGASNAASVQVHWGTSAGTISVRAVNACGNSGARSKSVSTSCTGGLEELVTGLRATLYPNPAREMVTVRITTAGYAVYRVIITDVVGRTMVAENKHAEPGINLFSFDVSRFAKGSYLVSIHSTTGSQVLRMNVQ